MVKCDICKEKLQKTDVFTQDYTNKNGILSSKKGHQKCVETWLQNYNSVKCDICGEKLPKSEIFTQEYDTKNGVKYKQGHRDCVEYWYRENYWAFSKMRRELISTLEIDQLTKQMLQRLNQLHRQYCWDVITETIKIKRDILPYHYRTKGWNYVYAIIENEATRVNVIEKAKQRERNKAKQVIDNVVHITEYQKQESRDISKFLE